MLKVTGLQKIAGINSFNINTAPVALKANDEGKIFIDAAINLSRSHKYVLQRIFLALAGADYFMGAFL